MAKFLITVLLGVSIKPPDSCDIMSACGLIALKQVYPHETHHMITSAYGVSRCTAQRERQSQSREREGDIERERETEGGGDRERVMGGERGIEGEI